AEDGIRDLIVTGVQTCALPIYLLEDPKLKDYIVNSFMPLSEDATLADAKDLLDKNPQCLDILVTQDGTKNGIVVGWITNVMVLRSEEHTSELQSRSDLVCRLLL